MEAGCLDQLVEEARCLCVTSLGPGRLVQFCELFVEQGVAQRCVDRAAVRELGAQICARLISAVAASSIILYSGTQPTPRSHASHNR